MHEIAAQNRRLTDALDNAVIIYRNHEGVAPVARIAKQVHRAYSTVLVRYLKLEAAGILRSEWYNHTRFFTVAYGSHKPRDESGCQT